MIKKIIFTIVLALSVNHFCSYASDLPQMVKNYTFAPNNNDPQFIAIMALGAMTACSGVYLLQKSLKGLFMGADYKRNIISSVIRSVGSLIMVGISLGMTAVGTEIILHGKSFLIDPNKSNILDKPLEWFKNLKVY